MKTKMMNVLTLALSLTMSATAFAGGVGGGGGDASEARVNEIRADLLSWIEKGGARNLDLPASVTLDQYEKEMSAILVVKKVSIAFVENDEAQDEELKVLVDGVPKTCRGFYSRADSKPRILCNISRFQNISEDDQYRLIHHEYAGLVNIEKNDGAASDYEISNQLTDFLENRTVKRLAIKERVQSNNGTLYGPDLGKYRNPYTSINKALAWPNKEFGSLYVAIVYSQQNADGYCILQGHERAIKIEEGYVGGLNGSGIVHKINKYGNPILGKTSAYKTVVLGSVVCE